MSSLDKKKTFWACSIIVIFIFAAFASNISSGFMLLDDGINTYQNPHFKNITINNLKIFWTEPYENLYIPITYMFWACISVISKILFEEFSPLPFHFANIIIHIFNSILIYILVKNLSRSFAQRKDSIIIIISVGAALLFGIHPIQVEAVSWISGMKDLLSTCFSLCAIILVIDKYGIAFENEYIDSHKIEDDIATAALHLKHKSVYPECGFNFFRYLFASGFYLLALLSKPNTVVVPFLIIIITSVALKKKKKQIFIQMLPWIFFSILLAVAAKNFMNPGSSAGNVPQLYHRLVVSLDTIFFYLRKIIWPHPLIYDYGRKIDYILNNSFLNILTFTIFIIAAAAIWRSKYKTFLIGFALSFIVSISPYSGLIPFEFQRISTVADRYCYLGMSVCCVFAGLFFLKYIRASKIVFVIVIALLSAFFVKTLSQVSVWQDNIVLNKYVLLKNSNSFTANLNLGIAFFSSGTSFNEAIEYIKKAIVLAPLEEKELAIYNLGVAYACKGEKHEVERLINELTLMKSVKANELNNSAGKIFEAFENNETSVRFQFSARP